MSKVPGKPAEDDVQRLLKQINMNAFKFRSFNRPAEDDAGEYDPSAEHTQQLTVQVLPPPLIAAPLPVPPPPPGPSPTPVPAAAQAEAMAATGSDTVPAVAVDVALGRLIRGAELRNKRQPAITLNLKPLPKVVELQPADAGQLPIADVLGRLYRLGSAKMTLVRQRGDA